MICRSTIKRSTAGTYSVSAQVRNCTGSIRYTGYGTAACRCPSRKPCRMLTSLVCIPLREETPAAFHLGTCRISFSECKDLTSKDITAFRAPHVVPACHFDSNGMRRDVAIGEVFQIQYIFISILIYSPPSQLCRVKPLTFYRHMSTGVGVLCGSHMRL